MRFPAMMIKATVAGSIYLSIVSCILLRFGDNVNSLFDYIKHDRSNKTKT